MQPRNNIIPTADGRGIEQFPTAGVDPALLGEDAAAIEIADHGPYYLYSPGEAIHRVDMYDTVPHIYAGLVTPCTTMPHWQDHHKAPPNSTHRRTVILPDGKQQIEHANLDYALGIMKMITSYTTETGTGYGNKEVFSIDNFAKMPDEIVHYKRFNMLIAPHTVAWERVMENNGRLDDVPPDRVQEWERSRQELRKRVAELGPGKHVRGPLGVRKIMVEEAANQLELGTAFHPRGATELWLGAIEEILVRIDRYYEKAVNTLEALDNEIEAARNGNSDSKKKYDPRDLMLKWLIGYTTREQATTEAVNKQPTVHVHVDREGQVPEGGRVVGAGNETAECPRCYQPVHPEADYCRHCQLANMKQARKRKEKFGKPQQAAVQAGPQHDEGFEDKPESRPEFDAATDAMATELLKGESEEPEKPTL